MRTTIDLPNDLHMRAKAIAHERSWTLNDVVVWLMRRGLEEAREEPVLVLDELTGILTLRGGPAVTAEEVERFLDEDE